MEGSYLKKEDAEPEPVAEADRNSESIVGFGGAFAGGAGPPAPDVA